MQMPLDGATLASAVHELKCTLHGARIDKIIQPEPDELMLTLRAAGVNYKLLLSVNAQAPRIHLAAQNKTAPLTAPQFCMVLRKHLAGGRVIAVWQPDFERIVAIDVENRTELGDITQKTLRIEIMGKHSNIILSDAGGKILDAIKHVPPSVSTVRTVLPGAMYTAPPNRGKVSPLDNFIPPGTASLFERFNGISPVLSEEICLRAAQGGGLETAFTDFVTRISNGDFSPHIYYEETGKAVDITPWPFLLYAHLRGEAYESPSEMLETFYAQRDAALRLRQRTTDLRKTLATLLERCRKKGFAQEKDLAATHGRDRLRIMGELLTAYLHKVERGAKSFTAENFYDNNATLDIPLDPTLAPAENAQKYFRQYNKQKRAAIAVAEQIKQNNADIDYLESVLTALQNTAAEEDIAEIRAELAEQGFVKRRPLAGKKQKSRPSRPLHYISSDGFDIYVGKNNTQNDTLTLRTAHATDIWLHTKDIAGSHVILITRGADVPERTLAEAANLAAWHSKARNSSNVPVDYVQRKHVRKPAGAKPGYVIYDFHKTLYVTPQEPICPQP